MMVRRWESWRCNPRSCGGAKLFHWLVEICDRAAICRTNPKQLIRLSAWSGLEDVPRSGVWTLAAPSLQAEWSHRGRGDQHGFGMVTQRPSQDLPICSVRPLVHYSYMKLRLITNVYRQYTSSWKDTPPARTRAATLSPATALRASITRPSGPAAMTAKPPP